MKFEKVNENKIRITFSIRDLEEKDIDFHNFMSNPIETQDLFLLMLQEAEEKVGFKTKNCKVKIEALAMTEDNFVLTITKILPEPYKRYKISSRKPIARRKSNNINYTYLIYRFNSFDDYYNFIEYLYNNNLADSTKIAKNIFVYLYNNYYYLVLNGINSNYAKLTTFFTSIVEFASYVSSPELIVRKLNESGTVVIKNNAIRKSCAYFQKK